MVLTYTTRKALERVAEQSCLINGDVYLKKKLTKGVHDERNVKQIWNQGLAIYPR